METKSKTLITVQTVINSDINNVWKTWNEPKDIVKWCTASDDWHTPKAENDLRIGGKLTSRMEAKDGSIGFDFVGVYDNIITNKLIEYTIADGRKVKITFGEENGKTKVTESFEAEELNSIEMQRGGWQSILDNFKKHTESKK